MSYDVKVPANKSSVLVVGSLVYEFAALRVQGGSLIDLDTDTLTATTSGKQLS